MNSAKCKFFVKKLKILKFERNEFDIRPSIDKIATIRDYSKSKDEKELLRFCYMLSFLRAVILDRANLCAIMKRVIVEEIITYTHQDRKRTSKIVVKFR